MNANARRHALQTCTRWRATGFMLGICSLALFFLMIISAKDWIDRVYGQPTYFWILGLGPFVAFLLPQFVFERIAVQNPWLRCPECEHFLASFRAARYLHRRGRCIGCQVELPLAAPNPRESRIDGFYIAFSSWGAVGLLYLVYLAIR